MKSLRRDGGVGLYYDVLLVFLMLWFLLLGFLLICCLLLWFLLSVVG